MSTDKSFFTKTILKFVQDGLGIGNTDFKLMIKSIDGAYTEKRIKINVSHNWQDLSMKILD
ncbi:MAG TPA: hypothetical protein VIZ62_13120 [Nitrososphaeraceae archaeon]